MALVTLVPTRHTTRALPPHRTAFLGNYDINVLELALQERGKVSRLPAPVSLSTHDPPRILVSPAQMLQWVSPPKAAEAGSEWPEAALLERPDLFALVLNVVPSPAQSSGAAAWGLASLARRLGLAGRHWLGFRRFGGQWYVRGSKGGLLGLKHTMGMDRMLQVAATRLRLCCTCFRGPPPMRSLRTHAHRLAAPQTHSHGLHLSPNFPTHTGTGTIWTATCLPRSWWATTLPCVTCCSTRTTAATAAVALRAADAPTPVSARSCWRCWMLRQGGDGRQRVLFEGAACCLVNQQGLYAACCCCCWRSRELGEPAPGGRWRVWEVRLGQAVEVGT